MKTKYQIANKWYQDRGIITGLSKTDLCVLSSNDTIFVQVSETEVDKRCKEVVEETRNVALEMYEKVGASAVYDYANILEIEHSYCTGCEAETPTLTDGSKLCECLVCGGSKES